MVYITDVQIILLPNKIKDNMTKINEILTSIILYSIISYILGLNHLEMGLLFAVLGSQANILLPQNYKHTLFLVMPLSIVTLLYPTIFFPVTIGYISSIFISLLSKNGCKLIYPLKNTTFTGPKNYLENNTKKDYAATTFLVTLVIITLIFSFNGTEIMEQLNQNNDITSYFNSQENQTYNESLDAIQHININPAECNNMNITTIKTENTTTTIISPYEKV